VVVTLWVHVCIAANFHDVTGIVEIHMQLVEKKKNSTRGTTTQVTHSTISGYKRGINRALKSDKGGGPSQWRLCIHSTLNTKVV
jgi:hypothetical protein